MSFSPTNIIRQMKSATGIPITWSLSCDLSYAFMISKAIKQLQAYSSSARDLEIIPDRAALLKGLFPATSRTDLSSTAITVLRRTNQDGPPGKQVYFVVDRSAPIPVISRSTTVQKFQSNYVLFSQLDSTWHLPNQLEYCSTNEPVLGPEGGQRYATLHALISVLERAPILAETTPRALATLLTVELRPYTKNLFMRLDCSTTRRNSKLTVGHWIGISIGLLFGVFLFRRFRVRGG